MARHPHLLVLANQSVLWRKLLGRLLNNTPGMLVVDDSGNLHALPDLFRQVRIDWLVVTWQAEGRVLQQVRLFAQREPSLSLLAIAVDGSYAEAYCKTRRGEYHRIYCQGFTLAQLVTILRYKPGDAFPRRESAASSLPQITDLPTPVQQKLVRKQRVK